MQASALWPKQLRAFETHTGGVGREAHNWKCAADEYLHMHPAVIGMALPRAICARWRRRRASHMLRDLSGNWNVSGFLASTLRPRTARDPSVYNDARFPAEVAFPRRSSLHLLDLCDAGPSRSRSRARCIVRPAGLACGGAQFDQCGQHGRPRYRCASFPLVTARGSRDFHSRGVVAT